MVSVRPRTLLSVTAQREMTQCVHDLPGDLACPRRTVFLAGGQESHLYQLTTTKWVVSEGHGLNAKM